MARIVEEPHQQSEVVMAASSPLIAVQNQQISVSSAVDADGDLNKASNQVLPVAPTPKKSAAAEVEAMVAQRKNKKSF